MTNKEYEKALEIRICKLNIYKKQTFNMAAKIIGNTLLKRYFSAYGNKFRKYCSHDCYVMDRFWKNGNLNHVVPKSKIRAGIKDIVLESQTKMVYKLNMHAEISGCCIFCNNHFVHL